MVLQSHLYFLPRIPKIFFSVADVPHLSGLLFMRPNSLHHAPNLNTNILKSLTNFCGFSDYDIKVSVMSVVDTIIRPKLRLSRGIDGIHTLQIKMVVLHF